MFLSYFQGSGLKKQFPVLMIFTTAYFIDRDQPPLKLGHGWAILIENYVYIYLSMS